MYMNFLSFIIVAAFVLSATNAVALGGPKVCPAGKNCYCSFPIPTGKTNSDGSILRSGCFDAATNKAVDTYKGSSYEKIDQQCMKSCLKLDSKKIDELKKNPYSAETKKVLKDGPAKF
jgi:hypothetical protein